MVAAVVIRAEQHQIGQLGGTTVFPVPEVVGVQTTGSAAPGNRARAVAVLEGAAKPPVDHAGRPAGTDELAITFEPNFTGGITAQVAAFGIGQQRTQMQRRGALGHVEMHHHRGVLPVGPAGHLGIPSGLHQTHKRLDGARQRRPLI
ncbi:hypothetical protein LAUMK13_05760 [Mycobacterium innocens]|uniref:Uncharacterized protein n=1 Tax=Mycobacterium innocens TaxID=2341083 RepID=A0A498QJR1_9MYCO|nr:hypothetical protein LAUMK13_05760 [Mycobacterium innocens]